MDGRIPPTDGLKGGSTISCRAISRQYKHVRLLPFAGEVPVHPLALISTIRTAIATPDREVKSTRSEFAFLTRPSGNQCPTVDDASRKPRLLGFSFLSGISSFGVSHMLEQAWCSGISGVERAREIP